MSNSKEFIIRVYGIVINQKRELLLTDEYQLNQKMTKFPGGGMNYGEGTIDCLMREFKEECNGQPIKNIRHFYTTDFYQKALFFDNSQLISIYYLADLDYPLRFKISVKPFDFEKMENGNQSFRWVNLDAINPVDISFAIDKFVLSKLKNEF